MQYAPPRVIVAALYRVTSKRAWVVYVVFFCFPPEREERFICG